MSDLKRLISREIKTRRDRIRGKIVTDPSFRVFDPGGAQFLTPVADVDVGGDQILRDVPVKISGPKARFYAKLGSPVWLEKDAQGRYQITAPADRIAKQGNVIEIDEDTEVVTTGGSTGFTVVREAYPYYQGVTPWSFFDPATDPDTIVWLRAYDRLTGLPSNIVVASDADGADVLALLTKAPATNNAASTANLPVYRKFDALNPNDRSTVDFDGTNDGMDFVSNIVESSAGELSIFLMLQKDAAGAGDDVVLETDNFRVLSRRAAGDTWGVNAGGGIGDSGGAITTTSTLLEIIATDYNDMNLYQDGTFLVNISAAAAGLGLGQSSLGYSAAAAGGSHNGRVMELLILDRIVSATDRQNIEAYFNQTAFVAFSRWGSDGYPKITIFDANGNPV